MQILTILVPFGGTQPYINLGNNISIHLIVTYFYRKWSKYFIHTI